MLTLSTIQVASDHTIGRCMRQMNMKRCTATFRPGFHIIVSDRDESKSLNRRCYWHAYDDMGWFFVMSPIHPPSITDVLVGLKKLR